MHKDLEKCEELVEKILEKAHLDGLLLRPLWEKLHSFQCIKITQEVLLASLIMKKKGL